MVSDPASVAGVSTAESRVSTIAEMSSILKLCAPPSAVPTVIFDWSALKVMRVAAYGLLGTVEDVEQFALTVGEQLRA